MLSFFPRDVLDEIVNLVESVSEGFPSYSVLPILILLCLLAVAMLLIESMMGEAETKKSQASFQII